MIMIHVPQDPASDACALARFSTCSQGELLCGALTLGDAAAAEQRAAGRDYRTANCMRDSPLEVELVFAGGRLLHSLLSYPWLLCHWHVLWAPPSGMRDSPLEVELVFAGGWLLHYLLLSHLFWCHLG